MALEVYMTMCVRGHRVDPVQFIVVELVSNWARFLGRSHEGMTMYRLWDMHRRMAARAGLVRQGLGGSIFPAVTEVDATFVGPTAMLYEVLLSLGWSWPRLHVFCAQQGDFCMPLSNDEWPRFKHVLREAVRLRELRDTQHVHRRHGLPQRRDLDGVQSDLAWDSNLRLLRRLPPHEEGVLQTILCGGVMNRRRVSQHAKRTDVTTQCLMPGCTCPDETTEHRFWHRSAHEHLRSEEFCRLRLHLPHMRPCEINCGLATTTFPAGFSVEKMQDTMLRIELHARQQLDVMKHGYQGQDPAEEQRFYQFSTGTSGVHGRRVQKRPAAAGTTVRRAVLPQPPQTPHQLQFTQARQERDQAAANECMRRFAQLHGVTGWQPSGLQVFATVPRAAGSAFVVLFISETIPCRSTVEATALQQVLLRAIVEVSVALLLSCILHGAHVAFYFGFMPYFIALYGFGGFFLDSKSRNRMMHALNGNGDSKAGDRGRAKTAKAKETPVLVAAPMEADPLQVSDPWARFKSENLGVGVVTASGVASSSAGLQSGADQSRVFLKPPAVTGFNSEQEDGKSQDSVQCSMPQHMQHRSCFSPNGLSLSVLRQTWEEHTGGIEYVEIQCWLTQLRTGSPVTMEVSDMVVVSEVVTLWKMTFTFDPTEGWRRIQIIVREGSNTATVQVSYTKVVDVVLRSSGQLRVYTKMHPDEPSRPTQLLPLGPQVGHGHGSQAWRWCLRCRQKAGGAEPRFGIRFADAAALSAFAATLGLQDQALLGRYKVTSTTPQMGAAGIIKMMAESIKWDVTEVLFVSDTHVVVSAAKCPNHNKVAPKHQNGTLSIMHIKAMNAAAKQAFRDAKILFRTADEEGEDQDTAAAVEADEAAWHERRVKQQQQQVVRSGTVMRSLIGNSIAVESD
ncbi:unnamed protein product, partial [Symbiodinium sp. KB8]